MSDPVENLVQGLDGMENEHVFLPLQHMGFHRRGEVFLLGRRGILRNLGVPSAEHEAGTYR